MPRYRDMRIGEPDEQPVVQSDVVSRLCAAPLPSCSAMKKIFHALAALMLGSIIVTFVVQAWRSTAYLRANGQEGTLVIGQEYSSSRRAEPLLLKKIHTYTAVFGEHQVVIESDQQLVASKEYPIHYLTRDKIQSAPAAQLRPVSGALRLRTANDSTPVPADPTALFNRLVDRAVGVFSPEAEPSQVVTPEVKNTPGRPVPFQFGSTKESTLHLIWRNSDVIEWVALLLATMLFLTLLTNAWTLPFRAGRLCEEDENFVRPASRTA